MSVLKAGHPQSGARQAKSERETGGGADRPGRMLVVWWPVEGISDGGQCFE